MITESDILSLGFHRIEDWDTEDAIAYKYTVNRLEKGLYVQNIYRLLDYGNGEYFLKSNLVRIPDLNLQTRGFLGTIDTVDELEDIFDTMKQQNAEM